MSCLCSKEILKRFQITIKNEGNVNIDQTHTVEVQLGWGGLILSWGGCSIKINAVVNTKLSMKANIYLGITLSRPCQAECAHTLMQECKPALHASLSPVSDSVFIAWPYALKNHYSEAESMCLSLREGDLGVQAGTAISCSFSSLALSI